MGEAKGHIEEALELLDDALTQRPGPKPSARAIRGYLNEARVASDESRFAQRRFRAGRGNIGP